MIVQDRSSSKPAALPLERGDLAVNGQEDRITVKAFFRPYSIEDAAVWIMNRASTRELAIEAFAGEGGAILL